MALTLLESAKYATDAKAAAVMKIIVERSPVLQYLEMETIQGNAYKYDQEQALPGIAFRAVGETWPQSTGMINPIVEQIVIMGGEIFIDNFQIRTQSPNIKARQWEMKARALGITFSEYFFEGDSTVTLRSFDGMRPRITGNQLIAAGTNGATVTLDMLDTMIDGVPGGGDGDTHLFMNKTTRRNITKRARDFTSIPLIDIGTNALGKQVTKYNGVPIEIVERSDNEDSILNFDETQGSASGTTASIYLIRFGPDFVHGIQGAGGSMEVKDFGEIQSAPGVLGRIEWYPGIVVRHPRAAVRLKGILNG